MSLRDHRDSILRALTLAVDACIKQQEEILEDHDPVDFESWLTFRFNGTDSEIRSAPALDFTQPMEPQLRSRVEILLVSEEEPDEVKDSGHN